jgi:hypothetical protein
VPDPRPTGAGRRFYGDPSLSDPPAPVGRPPRHGPKMKCADPSTWPEPSAEHACEDAGGYGSLCACGRGLNCTRRYRTTRGEAVGAPCPSWSARSSWSRSKVCPGARVGGSLAFCGCGGTGRRGRRQRSGSHLALVCAAFRSGAHLSLPQAEHGMDDAEGSPPRTGRPLELAGCGRLHTQLRLARARVRDPCVCHGSAVTMQVG